MNCTTLVTEERQFILPPEVIDLAGYPLYLVIATWGLRSQCTLTTALVSRAFLITQNQARDALHYIRNEGRTRIRCEFVPVRIDPHPFCRGIRIHSVDLQNIPDNSKRRRVDATAQRSLSTRYPQQTGGQEKLRNLRQWMISRRMGEPVPYLLLFIGK